jgi:serine/threonine protein kinase
VSTLTGTILGDYKIGALLGAGPTGEVYRAAHVYLGTAVALKVVKSHLTVGSDFKSHFTQHAQAVTSLQHPNIARTYHFGDHGGVFYVVTEMINGGSLESLVSDQTPLEWNNSFWSGVDLIQQAADGLAVVHDKGLIHGNIKPTNLLLPHTDAAMPAAVKLSDIGLTRLLIELNRENASNIEVSPYLSPEQRRGLLSDQRSDIYSLGALLYELTTRRPVFRTRTDGGGGGENISIVSPRQLIAQFPEDLEAIILLCLAESNERFASAIDLSKALRRLLDKVGVFDPRGTAAPRAGATNENSPPPRPQPIASAVPTIQVLDRSGNRVDLRPLSGAGVTLGTAPDNTIILRSADVSPRHAKIEWDGKRVTVTDLGSSTSTFLQGHRLLPQVSQEWIQEQWLHIGPYWIWLDHLSEVIHPSSITDVLLDQSTKVMTFTPGKPGTFRVVLVNQKAQVDHVFVTVEGVPEEWIEGASRDTRLQPFEKKELVLTVKVPRDPSSRAGEYPVRIRANSRANPASEQGSATATWIVASFEEISVSLAPPKAAGTREGRYTVNVRHTGNVQTSCTLSASDDDKGLEFRFAAGNYIERPKLKVELLPGVTTSVKLKVNAPRHWIGTTESKGFTVNAQLDEGGDPQTAEGQFGHRAMFPNWTLVVAPVLLIVLIFFTIYFGKPQLPRISVDPSEPLPGQPVEIRWVAPSATRVEVLVNDLAVSDLDPSEGKYVFRNGFTKDVRIKVKGSNIFGEATKDAQVLLKARPPAAPAEIAEFDVEPLSIAKGDSVTISWTIRNGTRAELTPFGTVPLRGSRTDKPQTDQAYALTAFNAENLETKQSLQVKVGAPPVGRLQFTASNEKGVISASHKINVGDTIIFRWDAKNAQSMRIDSISPTQLESASGQKQARFKGQGAYTFTLVATNDKGDELRSSPIEVRVTCSLRQKITPKSCSDTPQVEWK